MVTEDPIKTGTDEFEHLENEETSKFGSKFQTAPPFRFFGVDFFTRFDSKKYGMHIKELIERLEPTPVIELLAFTALRKAWGVPIYIDQTNRHYAAY